uniref:Hcy-binding domain-containing protein n=1 Tax=Photinus pyralis TaxID=7054 RepID=A0A1Y1LCX9_PHOPY
MAPFNITNLNSDNIHVLDGGFATQLGCHIVDHIDGDPLWSARFLKTQPQAVIDTHLDFLRAGADVIMTNTYQASIPGFQKYLNLSAEEGYDLIKEAVNYAKIACDRFQEEFSDNCNTIFRLNEVSITIFSKIATHCGICGTIRGILA